MTDIAVAEGDLWHEFTLDPIIVDLPLDLMQQSEDGSYLKVSEEYGFGQLGSWRTIVALDHNGDGIVDPIAGDVEDRAIFLMSEGCTANGWFEVDAPMHSRVEVVVDGVTHTGWTMTHSSFGGAHAPIVHFGLGDAQAVDSVRVLLPSGEEVVYDEPLPARRQIIVR